LWDLAHDSKAWVAEAVSRVVPSAAVLGCSWSQEHRPPPDRFGHKLQVHSIGDWWEAPPDSCYMRMAERALAKEWGVQPLLVREGEAAPWDLGSLPPCGCTPAPA
jgi:hypothetical protein